MLIKGMGSFRGQTKWSGIIPLLDFLFNYALDITN